MLNDRLRNLHDYPFQRLRDLLDPIQPRTNARPIALSLGEPQHPVPAFVAAAIAAEADGFGRYPPVLGTEAFRAAFVDWLNRRYRLPAGLLDVARHVLPLSGTREGLYMLAQLVVPSVKGGGRPAVLMPSPFYPVYDGAAVVAGAEGVMVPAGPETGFLPDYAALPPELLRRTALAYLCSPANPQGTVADAARLRRMVALAREYDFVLAVDECYAEIYPDTAPPGVLEVLAADGGDLGNVLAFHSLSKRSSVPGLRIGGVVGDPDLIKAFARLRSYGHAGIPAPLQAAAAALWRDEAHVEENRRLYRAKFDMAERLLAGRHGYYRPAGGFFLWLDVGDSVAVASRLWRDAAVRVLPGEYLAAGEGAANPGRRYIRVALVAPLAETEEALTRLVQTLEVA